MVCILFLKESIKQEVEIVWIFGIGVVVKKIGGYFIGDFILYRFKDVLYKQFVKIENMVS